MGTRILKPPPAPEVMLEEFLNESISGLDLPQRDINKLEEHGIVTNGDLLSCCSTSRESCQKFCKCRAGMEKKGAVQKNWSPKCYLLDIPGIAEGTVNNIIKKTEQQLKATIDAISQNKPGR